MREARTVLLASALALAAARAGALEGRDLAVPGDLTASRVGESPPTAGGENARVQPWPGLHAAAAEGRSHDVEALLARGADPNARDGVQATPLHAASLRTSNDATVEALLSRGADVRAADVYGATPLHWAAASRRPGAARLLLDAGADMNARAGQQAFTPLHAAAAAGDLECVELLIRRGANLAARDAYGRTPLGAAETTGHGEVASRLRQGGGAPGGSEPPPVAPAPAVPGAEQGGTPPPSDREVPPRKKRGKTYVAPWFGTGGGVVNGPDGSTEFVQFLLAPLPLSAGVGLGVPAGRHLLAGVEWNITLGFNCVASMNEASGGCDRGVLLQHLLAMATFFPLSRGTADVAPLGPFVRGGAGLAILRSWSASLASTSTSEKTTPKGWRRAGPAVLAGLGYAVRGTETRAVEVGLDLGWEWYGRSPSEPRSSFSSVFRCQLTFH